MVIFKLNINFHFLTNFYISEMFLPISQNDKARKPAIREQTYLKNEILYDYEIWHKC